MGLAGETQHDETVGFTSQMSAARQRPWLIPFVVVIGVSFCARLLFVVVTSPVWWPDSIGYMQLARLIGRGNLAAGQGIRTPGYPLFMLLNDFNLSAIRATQMIMGLAITSGIFWIIWTLNHKPWLASLGALLYGLSIAQVRLESFILTETLATAFLLGALVSLVSLRTSQRRDWWKLLAMGVFAGLLPLVRPLYVFVPLLFAIPVASVVSLRSRRFWLYFLPAIRPVVVWVGYLGVTFDYVGLQTASGFGWTNHAGAFMKDAPQRYATIRDIYLRHEATHRGQVINTIWSSIPDMQKATGQTYPELSETVQSLSFTLIASHPVGYARQVATAFVGFWKGLSIDKTWNPLGTLTGPIWRLCRYLWLLVSFCFVVVVLGLLATRLHLIPLPELPSPTGWMVLTVLISGILQALVEYGSATRFGMPTQPFVSVVVMLALGAWVTGRRRQQRPPTP